MGIPSKSDALGGGLKSRHVTMLSIAGVIRASLFVGSSVAIALDLTGSDLHNYGEFEFWLAVCKAIAILAFIAAGTVAISGFYPGASVSGILPIWNHCEFMSNGLGAVLSAMQDQLF